MGPPNLPYFAMIISIFPLAVFILSAINVKVKPLLSILNEITSTMNDYPLADLSYEDNCEQHYSQYLYVFPGSKEGCSCINTNDYKCEQSGKYKVSPGFCDYNQTYNGCKDISKVDKQYLYSWGKGKFCSKKYNTEEYELKGYLHFLNNSVLEKENCENGYKKCGKLDDMGNYICVNETEECPINDIKVTYFRDEELERLNYSHIIINFKYFYYTNTSEKPVISKLKVAEDGKICADIEHYYTRFPQYILDNNFLYYGCRNKIGEFLEKNIEILDNRTKKQIYSDSNVNLNKYSNQDSDYPFYSLEANMSFIHKDILVMIKNVF